MFNVGDVVKIQEDDLLRGGEQARVMEVLPLRPEQGTTREYVCEFQCPSRRFPNSDRFNFCIFREDQLIRQGAI
jgi:hypothetical protein